MAGRKWPSRRLTFVSLGALLALLLLGVLLVLGVLGDVYEPLGDFPHDALVWVRHNGPGGAIAALYVEESGVPVLLPGDVFVVYLGRHLSSPVGWFTAWLALIAAVVLGATNLYWISRRWGRRLLEGRIGRVVHLTPQRLDKAERWFARYGVWALIFGRHIPGFRVPITIAAGTLQVRYRVFAASVAVSSAIWAGIFLLVGMRFGRQFERFLGSQHVNYAVVLAGIVGVIVIGWGARHRQRLQPGIIQRRSSRSFVVARKERKRKSQGQGMVEYALILALIAIVVIVILILLGNQVRNAFSNVSAGLGY